MTTTDILTENTGSVSRSPKVEKVLLDLRERIMIGAIKSEQELAENALSAYYSVSRGSIRRALQALESEGLVIAGENGRRTPVKIDEKFNGDLYKTRLLIESEAIRICLEKDSINTSLIATAFAGFYTLYSLSGEELYIARNIINTKFHRAIVETSENLPLIQCWNILEPMVHGISKFNYLSLKEKETNDNLIAKHQILMDLIFRRDEKALKEIETHIMDAMHDTGWGLAQ